MKYLKKFNESIIKSYGPNSDDFHSIDTKEWMSRRGFDNQENWSTWEVEQLKDFAKKWDNSGSNSNRSIGAYIANIDFSWGRLLIDKSKDEWYLVKIDFWKNQFVPDKTYWKCDGFRNLIELLEHLSNNLQTVR